MNIEARRKGTTKTARTAARVAFMKQLVIDRPTLMMEPSTVVELTCAHFGCGEAQAKASLHVLQEELKQLAAVTEADIAVVKAGMLDDIDSLRRAGKRSEASLAAYRFAKVFGIAAPEVEVNLNLGASAADDELTDEQLEALAALEHAEGSIH